ncbi:YopX family protein [Bacillus inaquosorum]|uniref:YopX family protein n=1 Tax=Bacillus inaquosorum TaxID=483913 RepID=UPI002E1D8B89|nr:YopX family protein [Bacillus inaquosorum]MED4790314.1 YopX family protein [Bacillus inaquosorum]
MREIKFRAWYGENIGMLTPQFNGDINEIFAENNGIYMQYTGLKDRNGRDIYEGDILKRTVTVVMYGSGKPPEDIDEYMKVEYREDYAGFYIGERPLFAYVDNTRDVDTGCRCTKAEVIGNIYKDPELLESPHASK